MTQGRHLVRHFLPFTIETARLLAAFIRRRAIPMILGIAAFNQHALWSSKLPIYVAKIAAQIGLINCFIYIFITTAWQL
ncbi:hypothetical protein [Paraglaciecola sp.]|uniref:hypothetical protein n=1 Tax=Paraglaciecola sp. TaxID=1920173 RepID=UPI0030F46706